MHANNNNDYSNCGKTVAEMKQMWEYNNHINQLWAIIGKRNHQLIFDSKQVAPKGGFSMRHWGV